MYSHASHPTNHCVQAKPNDAAMEYPLSDLGHTSDITNWNSDTRPSPKTLGIHDRIESTWLLLDGASSTFQPQPFVHSPLLAGTSQETSHVFGTYLGNFPTLQPTSVDRPKTSRGLSESRALKNSALAEKYRNFRTTGQFSPDENSKRFEVLKTRKSDLPLQGPVLHEQIASNKELRASARAATRSNSNGKMTPARAPDSPLEAEVSPSRSRESSLDLQEFNPVPQTPSTLKATFGRIGRKFKPATEKELPEGTTRPALAETENETRRPKGLRKSISSWSIRNLPRKVKSSSNLNRDAQKGPMSMTHNRSKVDLAEAVVSEMIQADSAKEITQADVTSLDERKRKAEAAHTDPYRSNKRQKDSLSFTPVTHHQYRPSASPLSDGNALSRSVRRRSSPGTLTFSPSSRPELNPNTARSVLSSSSAPNSPVSAGFEVDSSPSIYGNDCRNRPSRHELEKENQVLRRLLREAQSKSAAAGAPRALPQPPMFNRSTLSGVSAGSTEQVSARYTLRPSTRNGVPPVPCLPMKVTPGQKTSKLPQQVIKSPNWTYSDDHDNEKENSGNTISSSESSPPKRRSRKKSPSLIGKLPRPLSVVFEGVEDESYTSDYTYETHAENIPPLHSDQERSPCRPSFDWDTDTF